MRRPSEKTPGWIGFGAKQELADDLLLAEVVREVFLTLRSRGVGQTQAATEAYHAACDLVWRHESSAQRSPLAQVMATLHIFCLALFPVTNQKDSLSSPLPAVSSPASAGREPPDGQESTTPKGRTRVRGRGKNRNKGQQPDKEQVSGVE